MPIYTILLYTWAKSFAAKPFLIQQLAPEIMWTPYRLRIMTFFGSFLGPSMAVNESQLKVTAALPRPSMAAFSQSI